MQPENQTSLTASSDWNRQDLRSHAASLIGEGRLEDAAALLVSGREMFADDVEIQLDQVSLAESANDWNKAAELLEGVIDRFPDTQSAYRRGAALYRRLGRDREAEAILVEGMTRFPSDLDLFEDYAAIAEARQDWHQATRRARLLCEKFPSHGSAHARLAVALRKTNRSQDAERALLRGQEQVPHDPHLPIQYAELAAECQDWDQAAQRFGAVRDRFPGQGWPYRRQAEMLKQAGRIAEAEAVLLDGQQRFPRELDLFLDHAELAAERKDWTEALRRFELLGQRRPDVWWLSKRMADILKAAGRVDEAEHALLAAQHTFPDEPALLIDHAELAVDRNDWSEALRRFRLLSERRPEVWWSVKRTADILKAADRIDEAETALLDGQGRFPEERALFLDHAELAAERKDWALARQRFEVVQDRFPDLWWSWKRIADLLKSSGRIDEAEAVLLDGEGRFPAVADLFTYHAELSFERKDWAETLHRFEIVRSRFPDLWWPYRRIAETLVELDRIDDGEKILLKGQQLFPNEPAMFFCHAEIARRMGRHEEALDRFETVHRRFPDDYGANLMRSRALTACGRRREAETTLIGMMRAFPDASGVVVELVHLTGRIPATARQIPLADLADMVTTAIRKDGETLDLLVARAHLAQLNGDHSDHMRQLIQIAERYPDAPDIKTSMVAAREVLLGIGEAIPGDDDAAPVEPVDMPGTPQELVGWFESLGGGGPGGATLLGCEFGFLQRDLKIEPLSLLRWMGVNLQNVTRLLENDFDDIGNPDKMVLKVVDAFYDWHVVDTGYGLHCDHSHLDRLTVSQEEARKMMCQRSTFLARKLREDLEDGSKIFVYRYSGRLEDETDMLALARAVNSFGKNMLLFVCRTDEHHAPGTVRRVHAGLVVGYIDWFTLDRIGYPVNLDGWMALCKAAYRLWRNPRETA